MLRSSTSAGLLRILLFRGCRFDCFRSGAPQQAPNCTVKAALERPAKSEGAHPRSLRPCSLHPESCAAPFLENWYGCDCSVRTPLPPARSSSTDPQSRLVARSNLAGRDPALALCYLTERSLEPCTRVSLPIARTLRRARGQWR